MKVNKVLILATLLFHYSFGQQNTYNYSRKIVDINQTGWYSIELPTDMFAKVNPNFSDLRIFSITKTDTTEVPYLLRINQDEITEQQFPLTIINKSERGDKQYATLRIPGDHAVNQLKLTFDEPNFNALITVEGSSDQKEWYTVIKDQRILSIKNKSIDYAYTTINFSDTRYRFLRLVYQSETPITLKQATITNQQINRGIYKEISPALSVGEKKTSNETIAVLKLHDVIPVSRVTIEIDQPQDFYRAFTIQALADSTQTQKGWIKAYEDVYSGYLTSLNANAFDFVYFATSELRILIENKDNPPLVIRSANVYYPDVALIAQLKPGSYYLFYGDNLARRPSYDLIYFQDKIPPVLLNCSLGEENVMRKNEIMSPGFLQSKIWLWAILLVALGILGFFTLKMLTTKSG